MLFCYGRDAMGPDTEELAELNFQIVELGLPATCGEAHTGGGKLVNGSNRLCRHDGTTGRCTSALPEPRLRLTAQEDTVFGLLMSCALYVRKSPGSIA
jgi:hypothetical protein